MDPGQTHKITMTTWGKLWNLPCQKCSRFITSTNLKLQRNKQVTDNRLTRKERYLFRCQLVNSHKNFSLRTEFREDLPL